MTAAVASVFASILLLGIFKAAKEISAHCECVLQLPAVLGEPAMEQGHLPHVVALRHLRAGHLHVQP